MKSRSLAIFVIFLALFAILVIVSLSHTTSSDTLIQQASPSISRDTAMSLENDSPEVSVPGGNNSSLAATPITSPSADRPNTPPIDMPSGMNGAPPGGMPNGAPPGGMPSNGQHGGASPGTSTTASTSNLNSSNTSAPFGSGRGSPTTTKGTPTANPALTQQTNSSGSSIFNMIKIKMPTIVPIVKK